MLLAFTFEWSQYSQADYPVQGLRKDCRQRGTEIAGVTVCPGDRQQFGVINLVVEPNLRRFVGSNHFPDACHFVTRLSSE
jgi:hypothetical protein